MMADWRKWVRWDYVVLVGVLVLAAGVRLYKLDTLPLGLYHDEAYNGLDALALLEGRRFPIFHEGWELYALDAHAERAAVPTRFPIFFEGNYGREPLHIYLMALSIREFGATPFAVRLVPALAGVLGVWAVYLVAGVFAKDGTQRHRGTEARRFNSQFTIQSDKYRHSQLIIPLLAAFTMAVLYPAVHFSRFGLRTMVFVPVEVLCVYFFWRGIEESRKEGRKEGTRGLVPFILHNYYFLISGFLLGLGLYVYAAGRLMPLVFVLFVPLWFLLERGALKRFWRPVAGMAAVATVTVLPLLVYFWRYPYFLFFRSAYVAQNGGGVVEGRPWLTRWLNVGRVIRGLFVEGEGHFRHNLPGRPFMDGVQSGFFVVGVFGVLRDVFGGWWVVGGGWRAVSRQPSAGGHGGTEAQRHGGGGVNYPLSTIHHPPQWLKALFLLIWFIVMLLPSVLSSDAPHFGRLTGVMPVVAVIIGLGAGRVLAWGRERNGQLPIANCQLSIVLVVGLLGVSGVWMVQDYFVRYAEHPLMGEDFYIGDWEAGLAMAALPEETALYVTPSQQELATFYFALGHERERLRNWNGSEGLIPAGVEGRPAAYFVRLDDGGSMRNLRAFFPEGVVGESMRLFTPFVVEKGREELREGREVKELGKEVGLYGWEAVWGEGAVEVTLVWRVEDDMARDYTAFVHMVDGESGEIVAQVDRPPAGYPTSDWRPGELIVDVFTVPLPEEVDPSALNVRTGFYFLPTLEPLGEPVMLESAD